MATYFEFEVSLAEIRPRIWRRFLIRAQASFCDLHEAIQDACGWENYHIFEFGTWDEHGEHIALAGIPDDEYDEPVPDARKVRLASFFDGDHPKTCRYLYDFGDAWEHEVAMIRVVNLPDVFDRRLVDGARAFPREDCGGVPGYEECVSLANGVAPEDGDAEGLKTWLGDWHPEFFDFQATRSLFDRIKRVRRKSVAELP